jgi:tRNA pseudouridine32 synthase/23S rRNA pseudouridine746 synthase
MVEYYEPKFSIAESIRLFPKFSADNIVYEDADLIAAFKPGKLPCTPSREQRHHSLKAYIEKYLGKEVHMPSRLDTSAQGLVVMSRSKRMHKHLQHAFEKHSAEKYYLLEVAPAVKWSRKMVDNLIAEDPTHPILRQVVQSGGQKAQTYFRVLRPGIDNQSSLLLAKPRTGRTHQLRVHTAHLGHPIVGDNFYGGIEAPDLHLLSFRLRFFNPLTDKQVEIELPQNLIPDWARE